MANYYYLAQDEQGKKVRGYLAAADQQELHKELQEQKLYLISAEETSVEHQKSKALDARSLSEFNRQIASQVNSGIPLVRSLAIICQQETLKPREVQAYEALLRNVRQGIPMSEAMAMMEGVFPPLLINMYKSAEVGGNLGQVAARMAIHYDKEWRLNSKVKSTTLYPKVLAVLMVVVVTFIMNYVLPQFTEMFDKIEKLPLPTVALMGLSGFLTAYWPLVLVGAVAVILIVRQLLKVPEVRLQVDKYKLYLPPVGKLLRIICTARFARTLSSLYSSGMPLVSSLEIARHTTGNAYIDSQFDAVISRVRVGDNLSDSLAQVNGLTKKLEFSVRVGEETGQLDAMLMSIADGLDYESEMAMSRMVSMLEPLLIVLMALIVGGIMLAVILPIYSSYGSIGAVSY